MLGGGMESFCVKGERESLCTYGAIKAGFSGLSSFSGVRAHVSSNLGTDFSWQEAGCLSALGTGVFGFVGLAHLPGGVVVVLKLGGTTLARAAVRRWWKLL
jgi:hypothetical protein